METAKINVYARVRPFNEKELQHGEASCIQLLTGQSVKMRDTPGIPPSSQTEFMFDGVFAPEATQQEVYHFVGRDVVDSVFQGINGTIFAYGQTASGKTYTCMGPDIEDPINKGLIPRLVEQLFQQISLAPEYIEFRLKVSFIEIYLERIRDLLDLNKNNLKIRQSKTKGIYVQNCTEAYVASSQEVFKYVKIAVANRSQGYTNMNEAASRSHMVFFFTVYQNNTYDESAKTAKLAVVDLAGSDKNSRTGTEGKGIDEAKQINKSLAALGNVIHALTQLRVGHVPYRDSKLTRVLQNSLGGNSITNLVLNVSPSIINDFETWNTLRLGNRAKVIRNKPKINRQFTSPELLLLLEKAQMRIKQMQRTIRDLGGNPGIVKRVGSIRGVQKKLSQIPANQHKRITNQAELSNEEVQTLIEKLQNELDQSIQADEEPIAQRLQSLLSNDVASQTTEPYFGEQPKIEEIRKQFQDRIQDLQDENDELERDRTNLNRELDLAFERCCGHEEEIARLREIIQILQNSNYMLFEVRNAATLLCGKLQEQIDMLEKKLKETERRQWQLLKKNEQITNAIIDLQCQKGIYVSKVNQPQVEKHFGKQVLQKIGQIAPPHTDIIEMSKFHELQLETQRLRDERLAFQSIEEERARTEHERRRFEQERSKIYYELQQRMEKIITMQSRLAAQKQRMMSMPLTAKVAIIEEGQKLTPHIEEVVVKMDERFKANDRQEEARIRRKNERILDLERELSKVKQELYRLRIKYEEDGGPIKGLQRELSHRGEGGAFNDAKIVKVLRSFSRLQSRAKQ